MEMQLRGILVKNCLSVSESDCAAFCAVQAVVFNSIQWLFAGSHSQKIALRGACWRLGCTPTRDHTKVLRYLYSQIYSALAATTPEIPLVCVVKQFCTLKGAQKGQ
eukprot:6176569-Pleurochrysis_carterae.AAC.2